MSTTVVISPVAAGAAGAGIASLVLGVGTGVWAAVQALTAQDETCRRLLAKSREQLRRERLAMAELSTTNLERLTQSALEAKFRPTPLPGGGVRFAAGPDPVWATRTPTGILLVGGEAALRRLLVANTTSRAVEHLKARGLRVETARTRSGAISLVGRSTGRQAIQVHITSSGEAHVDLDGFQGKACEQVVRDLATALEGTITRFCPKPEYYGGAAVTVKGTERV